MISSLSIENFALIDKLAIEFSDGFSIITGETGAGKSILLGALGLVLGKRADLTSLKNKSEKCVIEAHFDIKRYDLQRFFESHDLDYDEQTILRREILPSGKSRAFVNDSPVNLQELQLLGDYLIDIHSQHQTRELSEEHFQFEILDAIAGNQSDLKSYESELKSYRKIQSELISFKEQFQNAVKEHDYNTFLLDELLAAQLKLDQQEELEALYEQLSNVGLIKEQLEKSVGLSSDDSVGILQNMKEVRTALQKIAAFSPDYEQLSERTNSTLLEFADIVDEVSRLSDNLMQDPEQLEKANDKLQVIYSLQKKHHVNSVTELLEIQDNLDGKMLSQSTLSDQIAKLEEAILSKEIILKEFAQIIHNKRVASIPILSNQLTEILSLLGMPNVRFNIEVDFGQAFHLNGMDDLKFLFAANKGTDFGLLKKVASGGELSRIMLAVKATLAQYSKLPTIIFDEIDTGVSGEIADKMGEIMKAMSTKMQVLAITHLPQIAAKGNEHFKVFKTSDDASTITQIDKLLDSERITEIAQMLSGKDISESAINHAKALLN